MYHDCIDCFSENEDIHFRGCPLFTEEASDDDKKVRTFGTGATRDTDEGKYDYEGFLSPLVLERYARYMHKCRFQSDGTIRAGDNWQKGIPLEQYMKSAHRHFMDWWMWHRDETEDGAEIKDVEEMLCALLFNVMGYLHVLRKPNP